MISKKRILMDQPHTETSTGAVVSFSTDMRARLEQCKVAFTPVQEGTGDPNPTNNIRPITGWTGFSLKHTGKNLVYPVGYSSNSIKNMDVSTYKKINNGYGTSIDKTVYDPQNPTVTVTQTSSTTDYDKVSYRNGYFDIAVDGLVFEQRYCISFRVTNITSNPLNTLLSEMAIQSPRGVNYYATSVVGDRVIFNNYLYGQSSNYPQANCIEIRVCGMSFTLSDLMATPMNESDQTYKEYNGTTYSITFPTLGKNLLDITKTSKLNPGATGSTITIADGVISIDAVASSARTYVIFSQIFPAGTYTIKALNSGAVRIPSLLSSSEINSSTYNSYYLMYAKAFDNDNTLTFTLTESSTIGLVLPNNTGASGEPGTLYNIQLEYGSSATTYEPYTNTAYEGSLDLTTGVLTVTMSAYTLTGSEAMAIGSYSGTGGVRINSPCMDSINTAYNDAFSNEAVKEASVPSAITRLGFRIGGGSSKLAIFVPDGLVEGETTAEKFKTWLSSNPMTICSKLSEPIVVTLTPQQIKAFIGQNNIFADTNENTTVKYWKR